MTTLVITFSPSTFDPAPEWQSSTTKGACHLFFFFMWCLWNEQGWDYSVPFFESWRRNQHLYGVPVWEGCSLARVGLLTPAGVQVGESWGLVTSSDLPLLCPRGPRNNQPGLSSWMWTKVLARPVPAFSWNGLWFWEWLRLWVESLWNPLESELEPPRSVYDHAFWINLQASGDCFRVHIMLGRTYCQGWREQ